MIIRCIFFVPEFFFSALPLVNLIRQISCDHDKLIIIIIKQISLFFRSLFFSTIFLPDHLTSPALQPAATTITAINHNINHNRIYFLSSEKENVIKEVYFECMSDDMTLYSAFRHIQLVLFIILFTFLCVWL